MPIPIFHLKQDEPSANNPATREITLVDGATPLAEAIQHARDVGAFGELIIRRSDGGYDGIDMRLVNEAVDPKPKTSEAKALQQALADPAISASPVEDCPAGREKLVVVEAAQMTTRAAFDLAPQSPLKIVVVVEQGYFAGVVRGRLTTLGANAYHKDWCVFLPVETPLGDAVQRAREARLGDSGLVFVSLPNGEWATAPVWALLLGVAEYGAETPVGVLPLNMVPSFEPDDIGVARVRELASEYGAVMILSGGQAAGYVSDEKQVRQAARCPNCKVAGRLGVDTAAKAYVCGNCGYSQSLPRRVAANGGDTHHANGQGDGEATTTPEPPSEATRFVNPAFTSDTTPAETLPTYATLAAGQRYYFRLDIGPLDIVASIAVEPVAFPDELLPQESEGLLLRVLLFNDGFAKLEDQSGMLRLFPAGPAAVEVAAARPAGLDDETLGRYLYFGVLAPEQPGRASLRATIYYKNNLVQSWYVTAQVTTRGTVAAPGEGLRAVNDCRLCENLVVDQVGAFEARKINILTNDNGDGTHGVHLAGDDTLKASFTITEDKARTAIKEFRARLRKAMYANPDGPIDKLEYLYGAQNEGDEKLLTDALKTLAGAGWRLFDFLFSEAPTDATFNVAQELAERVRQPATLQFTVRDGGTWVFPWTSVYDRPLTGTPGAWTICDAFLAAARAGTDLATLACFTGACPHLGDNTVVCPSGFWGYRHVVELAPSVKGGELALTVPRGNSLAIDMGVSTDPKFGLRGAHTARVKQLAANFQNSENLADINTMIKASQAQVVYFFCHGDRKDTLPFLRVGSPDAGEFIQPGDVRTWGFGVWKATRPLVFINGCHTVDLEPEDLLNFAQRFIQVAQASGVIGTEITVVERFAVEFGEAFLEAFMGGAPVGEILRALRLKLLAKYNPLGSVYTPYCYAGLKLA